MTTLRLTIGACLAAAMFLAPSLACAKEKPAAAPAKKETAPAAAPSEESKAVSIKMSYRLDPRLTKSLYMGERWVSPPTYTSVQKTSVPVVKARATLHTKAGKAPVAPVTWTSGEPEMLRVKASHDGNAEITVSRAGESRVTVTSAGASATLLVRASEKEGVWQVEISEQR